MEKESIKTENNKTENNKKVVERLHYVFIALAVFICVVFNIVSVNPDNDGYFLIETGRYIVENKEVPTNNVWTIHEDFAIVIQQWVICVMNYLIHSNFGETGLIITALLFACAINVIMFKYTKLFTNNKKVMTIALCAMNVVMARYITTRPQTISIIVITLELILLEKLKRLNTVNKKNTIKFIAAMSLLSIIQINCHAAMWAMTIIIMLPYMVPQVWGIKKIRDIKIDKSKTIIMIASILGMIASALINPNGIKAITYIINSYKNTMNLDLIYEMRSPDIFSEFALPIIAVIILTTINIMNKKCNKELIYLTLGTLLMASMHIRSIWLISYSLIQMLSLTLNNKLGTEFTGETTKQNYKFILVLYTVTIVFITLFLCPKVIYMKNDSSYNSLHQSEVEIADYLDKNIKNKDEVRLFTEYNNGGYFEFRGYKVYIDPRAEAYALSINKKKNILLEYLKVYCGDIDYDKFIKEYKFTHLVVEKDSIFDTYLKYNDNYKNLYSSESGCNLYCEK